MSDAIENMEASYNRVIKSIAIFARKAKLHGDALTDGQCSAVFNALEADLRAKHDEVLHHIRKPKFDRPVVTDFKALLAQGKTVTYRSLEAAPVSSSTSVNPQSQVAASSASEEPTADIVRPIKRRGRPSKAQQEASLKPALIDDLDDLGLDEEDLDFVDEE